MWRGISLVQSRSNCLGLEGGLHMAIERKGEAWKNLCPRSIALEYANDPIFATRWMMPDLQHDFLMLENQLPFFVLQKLFELIFPGEETRLLDLALNFLDPLMPRVKKTLDKSKINDKPFHLLDLFRSSFLASIKETQVKSTMTSYSYQEMQFLYSATKLKEAGVQFKKRDSPDLLAIEFNNGVLEIPPVLIDDQSQKVFLNFVAYEQCDPETDLFFTYYVVFFDCLVSTCKDVELLHYNGILNHVFGSDEEVANLFKKLCKEVVYDADNPYLAKQLRDINRYCGTPWRMWRAKWVHDYFRSPWAFSSLVATIVLFFLTILQTIFSVLSYSHAPS